MDLQKQKECASNVLIDQGCHFELCAKMSKQRKPDNKDKRQTQESKGKKEERLRERFQA